MIHKEGYKKSYKGTETGVRINQLKRRGFAQDDAKIGLSIFGVLVSECERSTLHAVSRPLCSFVAQSNASIQTSGQHLSTVHREQAQHNGRRCQGDQQQLQYFLVALSIGKLRTGLKYTVN